MNKLALFLMSIGVLIFVITGADIISIVISVIEKIFSMNLNSQFFSSILFRGCLIILGGALLLIGGVMYKKNDNEIL